MGVRGLGKRQIKDRKETDRVILKFIRLNPGSYTRQIIKRTGKSPNAVESSLKRLYQENNVIKHTESKHFKNIKIPKNAVGYVYNYKANELEKKAYLNSLLKEQKNLLTQMKKFQIKDFKRKKPIVVGLAKETDELIKRDSPEIVKRMQNLLGINFINSSMIGFYIYKICEKQDLQRGELSWAPSFYYKMLPRKYCYIDIPYPAILIDFIQHNFPDQISFNELIDNGFSYFNKKTRDLIWKNFKTIIKKRGYREVKSSTK